MVVDTTFTTRLTRETTVPTRTLEPPQSLEREAEFDPGSKKIPFTSSSVPRIQPFSTEEVLKNWKEDENTTPYPRFAVLYRIEEDTTFSDYVKAYLKFLMSMVCQILHENASVKIGGETHAELMLTMLDEADVYRGFHAIDAIRLPSSATPFLNFFCGSTHEEVLTKLMSRFILKGDMERAQMVVHMLGNDLGIKRLPKANDHVLNLKRRIEKSISSGQDVRSYPLEELENLNNNFLAIITSMRETDGKPFTYNVRELLEGVWSIAFELSKQKSDWKDDEYLEKATGRDYYNRYYFSPILVGEVASGLHKHFTLSNFRHQSYLLFKQQLLSEPRLRNKQVNQS